MPARRPVARLGRAGLRMAGVVLLLNGLPTGLAAQEVEAPGDGAPEAVRVVRPGGEVVELETRDHRGFAAVPASSMALLGWDLQPRDGAWRLLHITGVDVRVVPGDPFFRWDGEVRQLVDAPYLHEDRVWVPAQLLLDFLPFRLPDVYRYRPGPEGPELHVTAAGPGGGEAEPRIAVADPASGEAGASERRVVVIDPGHGGRDLGAVGPGGSYEKDVALAVGLALARELERYPELEVHLTRDADVLVPLWRRGEWATGLKGERSGIFLSLHANALASPATRGFETYFLSEARTDHEVRVAAIENAPLQGDGDGNGHDEGLGLILNELRTLDHQHWSALLAELVQKRLGPVHPGPDRGVKQGPFAVITNALMPAVLVEVGFISNRQEERLLGRATFHEEVAGALARAVVDFFGRYPPERGSDLAPAGSSRFP